MPQTSVAEHAVEMSMARPPECGDYLPGSRAIDAFIGEPDMIGRGYGSVFLRLLAHRE